MYNLDEIWSLTCQWSLGFVKFLVEEMAIGEASLWVRCFSLPVLFYPSSLRILILILLSSERKVDECVDP